MDKNKKKGFTLVELIVVLAILAILAAMLVPALTGYIDKANEKKVIATARQYYVAAQTVVSEAYANGDSVNGFTISRNVSNNKIIGNIIIDNSTYENASENPYFNYFVNLAEITDDTKYMQITINDKKIDTLYLLIGNKQAILENDEWIVEPYDH